MKVIDPKFYGLPIMALPRAQSYSGDKLKAIRKQKKQQRKNKVKNR